MIIHKVKNTEKTGHFTECIFVETLAGIFVESPGNGFFQHPTIRTAADLKSHLANLKKEGFRILTSTHTVSA